MAKDAAPHALRRPAIGVDQGGDRRIAAQLLQAAGTVRPDAPGRDAQPGRCPVPAGTRRLPGVAKGSSPANSPSSVTVRPDPVIPESYRWQTVACGAPGDAPYTRHTSHLARPAVWRGPPDHVVDAWKRPRWPSTAPRASTSAPGS